MPLRLPQELCADPPFAGRTVVTHGCRDPGLHEDATHMARARRIASLLGLGYGGPFEGWGGAGLCYHIPRETLAGREIANRLNLETEHDLFGGWVPFDFMATKAIMHPLIPGGAAPEGWMDALPARAIDLTLRGFTVFSRDDALAAGAAMLERGPIRLKAVHASGGLGQAVVQGVDELEAALDDMAEASAAFEPLVVEENLSQVETYSVGQIRIEGHLASYFGTQNLIPDNIGRTVYGGSELTVMRGGFEKLRLLDLPEAASQAIAKATSFDRLVDEYIPGFLASRRNYDVASGIGPDGHRCVGLLEQSWRSGGATGAEIAAVEALAREPDVSAVRARAVEAYGRHDPPPDAIVLYRGNDPHVGELTKYTLIGERIFAAG